MFFHLPLNPQPALLPGLYIINTMTLIMLLIITDIRKSGHRTFPLYPFVTVFILLLLYTAASQFIPGSV